MEPFTILTSRTVVMPELAVVRHEHRLWEALEEDERDRLSRQNFYRFQGRWGKRVDLMVG